MTISPVLSVRRLTKVFGTVDDSDRLLPGFRDISFDLFRGESLGLVGESGCGKTTLARCITRLLEPDSGEIICRGQKLHAMRGEELRLFRRDIQIVFQNPETSLNPRMTVAQFLGEVFRNFDVVVPGKERQRLVELAELVGLREEHLGRYPHQLSGGQKQRVGLMRALASEPAVIVLDEPTSALDASVQAQVLLTLERIQEQTSTSFILISHDLAVVRYLCSRILVMYLGRLVEEAPTELLFTSPRHPYTLALFDAVPRVSATSEFRVRLPGEATTTRPPASACPLVPRCPFVMPVCDEMPAPTEFVAGHRAACWWAAGAHEQKGGVAANARHVDLRR